MTATEPNRPTSPPDRLQEATQRRVRAHGLASRAASIEAELAHAHAATVAARNSLTAESTDVRRLESISFTRVLATLRGDRSTELEREQAELVTAEYAVAAAEKREQDLQAELDQVRDELAGLGDPDADYAAALDAQQQWVITHDRPEARRLAEIAERLGHLDGQYTEGKQAGTAGQQARAQLEAAAKEFDQAGSWSDWDLMGGGMITDAMKYDHVDRASELLRAADRDLQRFGRELRDLQKDLVIDVGPGTLNRTFDVWFDNLFSDLQVRDRISESRTRAWAGVEAVDRALAELHTRQDALLAERRPLLREREQLLTGLR